MQRCIEPSRTNEPGRVWYKKDLNATFFSQPERELQYKIKAKSRSIWGGFLCCMLFRMNGAHLLSRQVRLNDLLSGSELPVDELADNQQT